MEAAKCNGEGLQAGATQGGTVKTLFAGIVGALISASAIWGTSLFTAHNQEVANVATANTKAQTATDGIVSLDGKLDKLRSDIKSDMQHENDSTKELMRTRFDGMEKRFDDMNKVLTAIVNKPPNKK